MCIRDRGRAAGEGADVAIVTNEDPRREDPGDIARAVIAGSTGGCARFETIHDRREAIARAFELARAGDTVVLAGKGHERYQLVGSEKRPFDERLVVRELLQGAA